jgi:hypothetical protein
MDASGLLLPGAVETVVRDEFGVNGYNLHLNRSLTRIPVYGRRIAVGFRFNSEIGPIGSFDPIAELNRQGLSRLPCRIYWINSCGASTCHMVRN